MILEEVNDLLAYLRKNAKCNAEFGAKDFGPDQYPMVNVRPEGDGTLHKLSTRGGGISIALELRIIVSKENALIAYQVFERVITNLSEFNSQRGHFFETEGMKQEFDANVFVIKIPYRLKFIALKA